MYSLYHLWTWDTGDHCDTTSSPWDQRVPQHELIVDRNDGMPTDFRNYTGILVTFPFTLKRRTQYDASGYFPGTILVYFHLY